MRRKHRPSREGDAGRKPSCWGAALTGSSCHTGGPARGDNGIRSVLLMLLLVLLVVLVLLVNGAPCLPDLPLP